MSDRNERRGTLEVVTSQREPLRAVINLGNAVLAQGTSADPRGVTVDIARELGRRLDRPVELLPVTAARDSVQAIETDAVELGFVAHDPDRARTLAFTDPYLIIEGCYAVRDASPLTTSTQVDRDGVRIGTKRGSALDLHLQREIHDAQVVQLPAHPQPADAGDLNVITGIRGPLTEALETDNGWRLLEPAFMQIRQCIAVRASGTTDRIAWLNTEIRELLASGFIADALVASGQPAELAASFVRAASDSPNDCAG